MMWWKLAVFAAAVFLTETEASTCTCYESGNYTGRSAPISNPYNPDGFSPCYAAPCSYVAYSGDENHIWTRLTFHWGTTTNSGGLIKIFDGTDITGTPIILLNEGENVLSGSTKSQIKSTSSRITITYSQTGTDSNVFYGVMKAIPPQ
ncbi:hypothetical protein GCK72_025962 [Caenorhabditis remanei]|uniref:CUB domain-containing protein n=1 Tax=Caenorhabditis remanei TaxID=31234 RepID=A0A6A5G4I4_CAERE|nr:hypothetical protein GCK72_025962 [Caenorhabditis remanei]KAF1749494.1 hypothetical protein GCK72_025962 [Caenorhabditis remanei]